jgi:hypothetical protein
MLKHLKESEIQAIITAAEHNNAAHPPSKLGVTLVEGLELLDRPDPTREFLEETIRSLSQEARLELLALTWFGRGDSIETDFAGHLAHAKRNSNDGNVNYIADKSPALPTYLMAALERLQSERPRSN